MMMLSRNKIKLGSSLADFMIYLVAGLAAVITVWPFIYVFSMSVSDPSEVLRQSVWLYPRGFSLDAYARIVNNAYLWQSYRNTVFYVVVGTALNCLMSVMAAYPLTKRNLFGRKLLVKIILIPMYFNGGLIPFFIIMTKLGLYNNILIMILPFMVTTWNIILVRTFFMGIPGALCESAYIDGANDFRILFTIIVPLSKPILAVIALYTAVGIWNNWFTALIFLPNTKLHPLQLFLAKVLVFESPDIKNGLDIDLNQRLKTFSTAVQLKYAVIIFSSLPIMCSYPFLQKYFIKGVLVGSLKE